MLNCMTTGVVPKTWDLSGGTLEFRTGVQEASPEATATGTLLATLTLNSPFASASTGADGAAQTLTANAITTQPTAAATGLAQHFRLLTAASVCAAIGDVAASGADINLSPSATITAGQPVAETSLTLPFAY